MLFKRALLALIPLSFFLVHAQAQTGPAQVPTEPDHFDLSLIDRGIDPCVDFYQYSCKKWIAANPIPSDQSSWSHGSKLALWNQGVLRDTLEKASAENPNRSAVEQKIGDTTRRAWTRARSTPKASKRLSQNSLVLVR